MFAINRNARTESGSVALAKSTLSRSAIAAIRGISVEQDSIGLVLRGQVPLYYHKQLAQELVRSALDDIAILNEIKVVHTD